MIHGFWTGALNPILIPAHLIVLVGFGLLLGQQGISHWKAAFPSFIVALLAGLWLTNIAYQQPGWDNALILLAISLFAGFLAVLAYPLPRGLTWMLAVMGGMMIGLDTAPTLLPGISYQKIYLTLAGTALSSSVLLGLVGLFGLFLHTLWQGIGVRVLGSWVTASALLTLALRFSHKA